MIHLVWHICEKLTCDGVKTVSAFGTHLPSPAGDIESVKDGSVLRLDGAVEVPTTGVNG